LRRATVIILLVVSIGAAGLAGCGSTGSSSTSASVTAASSAGGTHFAKTKFVLHAGLAFGAFHHFIYGPVKAGDLHHPFEHKLTLVKAGLASVFVYHELKTAAQDAHSSKILSTLFAPLSAAADKIKALGGSLTGGSASPSEVNSLSSQLTQIGSTAASKGQSITEAVPTASQLTSGG
jgi:hypothetical protein